MKILFVCTGNTCRSPMAEAMANFLFEKNNLPITACSRGLSVPFEQGASTHSIEVMNEMGIDINSHVARQITVEDIEECDQVVVMTESHKMYLEQVCAALDKPLMTIKQWAGLEGDISDPFGGSIEDYEECAAQIKDCIERFIKNYVDNE